MIECRVKFGREIELTKILEDRCVCNGVYDNLRFGKTISFEFEYTGSIHKDIYTALYRAYFAYQKSGQRNMVEYRGYKIVMFEDDNKKAIKTEIHARDGTALVGGFKYYFEAVLYIYFRYPYITLNRARRF